MAVPHPDEARRRLRFALSVTLKDIIEYLPTLSSADLLALRAATAREVQRRAGLLTGEAPDDVPGH